MRDYCDIHTHFLPEIDDGAKDWDMSVEMLSRAWKAGVRHVIATPHYSPWLENNHTDRIAGLCREARRRLHEERGQEMEIFPGQELYYHTDLIEQLEQGKALTLAGTHYILVEFAQETPYGELYRAVSRMRAAQYRPILAHVERYVCLRKKGALKEIADEGALIQMNLQSLQGGFFDGTSRWCKERLKEQTVQFLGSDMHNLTVRPPISAESLVWVQKNLSRRYQRSLLLDNAEHIYEDDRQR